MKRWILFAVAVSALGVSVVFIRADEQKSPGGYVRDLPADPIPRPKFPELPKKARPGLSGTEEMLNAKAAVAAEAAEAEYHRAIETNRKQPGTVPDAEVQRLHRLYSDSLLSAISKQVKSLQKEVDELRAQVQDLRTVKIRPVQSR